MGDEKKIIKTSKSKKTTVGSEMAAKLRSKCNELTKEERSAAYSRAITRSVLIQTLVNDEKEPLATEELDRRSKDLRSGRVKGIPAEKMIASARRRLRA